MQVTSFHKKKKRQMNQFFSLQITHGSITEN